MAERFKIPVGIFIMLRRDNQVLLQLRQNCSFAGFWGFVGGHLDGNEKIIDAAAREVKEEISVDINPQDLVLKTICHSGDGAEYLQFYFECAKWTGDIQNLEPDKCAELVWHYWDNLPDNVCPYLKMAVQKINQGIAFYEDNVL